MDWQQLRDGVSACRACRLCEKRKQAVLGVGDLNPQVLFVGEGPGAEEDERGEPFVGQAGKLLDAMLAAIGLARGKGVYIANTVKCRPPENRTPQADEMAACFPFLRRQIELLQPKLIVALGSTGGAGASRYGSQDRRRAWAEIRLRGRTAGGDLSPGVSVAQPARQGASLGRLVSNSTTAGRRRTGART